MSCRASSGSFGSGRTAGYAIGEGRISPWLEAIAGIRERPYPRLGSKPVPAPRTRSEVRASLRRVLTAATATRYKHPLPSARKGVRGKVCGAVLGSERLGVCSFKVLLWASLFSKACACVWAHVCGRREFLGQGHSRLNLGYLGSFCSLGLGGTGRVCTGVLVSGARRVSGSRLYGGAVGLRSPFAAFLAAARSMPSARSMPCSSPKRGACYSARRGARFPREIKHRTHVR